MCGIVLLIYILIIDPLIIYMIRASMSGLRGSFFDFLSRHFTSYNSLGVGPMWFVEVLLIFTLLYVVWRVVAKVLPQVKQRDGQLPSNLATALFALLLGVITFIWRIWLPEGSYVSLLNFPLASLPQYFFYSSSTSSPTGAIGWPASRTTASNCGSGLHPLIKFVVIGPLSVGLCFLIGYYLRKLPLVRRVL